MKVLCFFPIHGNRVTLLCIFQFVIDNQVLSCFLSTSYTKSQKKTSSKKLVGRSQISLLGIKVKYMSVIHFLYELTSRFFHVLELIYGTPEIHKVLESLDCMTESIIVSTKKEMVWRTWLK